MQKMQNGLTSETFWNLVTAQNNDKYMKAKNKTKQNKNHLEILKHFWFQSFWMRNTQAIFFNSSKLWLSYVPIYTYGI